MAETEKQPTSPYPCVVCGEPILKGAYCNRCIDRGFICVGCEGLSLLDVEEDAS